MEIERLKFGDAVDQLCVPQIPGHMLVQDASHKGSPALPHDATTAAFHNQAAAAAPPLPPSFSKSP